MRTAVRKRPIIAICVIAALSLGSSIANADPITSHWINQTAPLSKPEQPGVSQQPGNRDATVAKVDPADLVVGIQRKQRKNKLPTSAPRVTSATGQDETAQDEVPEIPWEMIELALQRQNQASGARSESDIVVGGDYQQLIINSLPDFALELAYTQTTDNIPILDFLRTQTAALSGEIATYTSDISLSDETIAMASNGNLDLEENADDTGFTKEGTKFPSLLKKLFYWGLGLLVLYTLLEAVFSKLRRQGQQGTAGAPRGEDIKADRPRRRRTFGRSRRRHRSA